VNREKKISRLGAGRNKQHCHDEAFVQQDPVLWIQKWLVMATICVFQEQEDASASRDPAD